jgi:YD repeat-containing protein
MTSKAMVMQGSSPRVGRLARRRGPLTALAAVLAALGLAVTAAPAAQAVPLLVDHDSSSVNGNVDGVAFPGDSFSIGETIINSELALSGVSGTLTSTTPGVAITQGSSAYPDLLFGDTGTNTTPFQATLSAGADCGMNMDFNLQVTTTSPAGGSQPVSFKIPTGTPGPSQPYNSIDVPKVIPDVSSITSSLQVVQPGRVKDVRVRIGGINHTNDGDLLIELVAPDGTSVVLANRRGGGGDNFVDTVFSSDASQGIASGSAPFTGTFRPDGNLKAFVGKRQDGTWKLKISDLAASDTGTLVSWGSDMRGALCDGTPTASFTATPNPVAPGNTVQFDGSASTDHNGTITKYEWDLDGNGTFETDTGSSPTTSHLYPTQGAVPVHLRVTDNDGKTNVTTVVVSVTQPPVASFTAAPGSPLSAQQVTFDGNGSFERDTGALPTVTTSYATPGVVPVRLRVTDNDGATNTKTVSLTVQNRAPQASFTAPAPAVTGSPATFNAAASTDPDGSVVKYEWDLDGDGASFEVDTGATPSVAHTYNVPGTVAVRLRVTDDLGATDVKTVNVTVTRPPVASFTATPNPVSLHRPVTFDASGSNDPDGPIAKYEWDLDGNNSFETDTGTTPAATHSYGANGTYAVKLRVTDVDGAAAVKTVNVVAVNQLPVASITATPNPSIVGGSVTLNGSGSSDSDGTVVKYDWDLDGNGSFESTTLGAPTISHVYPNPGSLPVGVRVTDNDGGTATKALTLSVQDPAGGSTGGGGSGSTGGGGSGSTGGGGSSSTGGGGSGSTGAGSDTLKASLEGAAIQRRAAVLRRGLAVGCRTDRAATCSLRAELSARDARRLGLRAAGRRPVAVGTLTLALPRAALMSARLRLGARARRALARARAVTIGLKGSVTDRSGRRVALKRTFLVRR